MLLGSQLRLKKLDASPLTLLFSNCAFSGTVFRDLMDALVAFDGDIQRFGFRGMKLSAEDWDVFFDALEKGRGFRTLEILEIDNAEIQATASDQVLKRLSGLLGHCRFLG
jgi:hypothetical protein